MYNLFENFPADLPHELCETLIQASQVRIERIVSLGQCSPEGFWYDQEEHEWVAVLRGEARLAYFDNGETVHLASGDTHNIPAHRKHRVEWTSPREPTVWLAVFYSE